MTHWFKSPAPPVCADCGLPVGHPSHFRACKGAFSGFGPGFAFCELEEGHDGPHLLRPWNGSEWLVSDADDGFECVETQPAGTRPYGYGPPKRTSPNG